MKDNNQAQPAKQISVRKSLLTLAFLPALFGLIFTGVPQYNQTFMNIYLIYLLTSFVGIIYISKKAHNLKDRLVAKTVLALMIITGIWTSLDAWRATNFSLLGGVIFFGLLILSIIASKIFSANIMNIFKPQQQTNKTSNNVAIATVFGFVLVGIINSILPHSADLIISLILLIAIDFIIIIINAYYNKKTTT